MMSFLFGGGRRFDAPCTVDLEQTSEFLHAHVEIDGVEVEPGDTVLVHDAPTSVPFGERRIERRMATIVKAGPLERLFTKATAYLELTELYEVGFSAGRAK
jgi:hypothetical protein